MPTSVDERPKVVLVVRGFLWDEVRKHFLLIRRSLTDTHNPGLWEVPGGKLDKGQDLEGALRREIKEETGFTVRLTQSLVFALSKLDVDGKYGGLPYVAFFHTTRVVGGEIALSEEHDAYEWVTHAEMLSFGLTPETKKAALALQELLTN